MDKLLQPDPGLMIWTVITFLTLVFILTKVAWKPILEALEKREAKIRSDLERAEQSHRDAEALRQKYETQLAETQRNVQEMLMRAKADAEKARTDILSQAKAEAEKTVEKGRKDLANEAERLKEVLKKDVAEISLVMTEKILHRAVDKKVQEEVLHDALKNLSEVKR